MIMCRSIDLRKVFRQFFHHPVVELCPTGLWLTRCEFQRSGVRYGGNYCTGDANTSAPHPVSQFHYESINDSVGPGITKQIGELLCGVAGEV